MPWARIDDQFIFHEKARLAGKEGRNLQITALCYCNSQLNDGYIKEGLLPTIFALAECDDGPATVAKLVEVGMWEVVEGGYQVHDYLEYNRSRAEVMAEREANAKRQADWQAKHRSSNGKYNGVSNNVSNSVINDPITTAPYPSPFPYPEDSLIPDVVVDDISEEPAPNGASHSKTEEYSEDAEYYAAKWPGKGDRKRLNATQRQFIDALVAETSSSAFRYAVDWCALKNNPALSAIATTARKKHADGKPKPKPETPHARAPNKAVLFCPYCGSAGCECADDGSISDDEFANTHPRFDDWQEYAMARHQRWGVTSEEQAKIRAAGGPVAVLERAK